MSDFIVRSMDGSWHDAKCPAFNGVIKECKCGSSDAEKHIAMTKAMRALVNSGESLKSLIEDGAENIDKTPTFKAFCVWVDYVKRFV